MHDEIKRKMVPEWDARFDTVMLAWPHASTDWAYMLAEVEACYLRLAEAIAKAGQKLLVITPEPDVVTEKLRGLDLPAERVMIVECQTNDTWTRDYAPLTVETADGMLRLVGYKFNGWGLKFASNFDNLATFQLIAKGVFPANTILRKDYVLEGGSVESDGVGTILTTSECMLSLNRNGLIDKKVVEKELASALGADNILWLDYGCLAGDDTDSHIDTLARFAPHDTILYVKSYLPDDEHNPQLEAMEMQLKEMRTPQGLPYNLIGLPLPDPIFDEDGERLPATYANFLITPRAVLMPSYGQPRNDELAARMLAIAFPDREILTVDCRALIRQHGSLHCATMQLPSSLLPM